MGESAWLTLAIPAVDRKEGGEADPAGEAPATAARHASRREQSEPRMGQALADNTTQHRVIMNVIGHDRRFRNIALDDRIHKGKAAKPLSLAAYFFVAKRLASYPPTRS
jgi:hypothetical protein